MMALSLQAVPNTSTDWRHLAAVVSIVFTICMLVFTLWRGRKRSRLRPLFDVLRTIVQVGFLVAVAAITGVVTPMPVVLGAILIGCAAGFVQAQYLQISLDGRKMYGVRSGVGLVVWGLALILMQVAALSSRTGLVSVGQGVAAFSIGASAGMIVGRQIKVDGVLRAAGALVVLVSVGLPIVAGRTTTASAMSCPGAPGGFTFSGMSGQICQYSGAAGETVAVSSSGAGCGDDRMREWTSRGGAAGADVNVKNDEAKDVGDGFTYFQRYMVLGQNGVVAVASRNFSGGVAQQFIGVAKSYSLSFQPTCAAAPAPTASPTTIGDGASPPPPQAGAAPTTAPRTPQTRIVAEDLDPNAVPEVQEIEDDGGSLFPEDAESTTTAPSSVPNEAPGSVVQEDAGEQDNEAALAAPERDNKDGLTADEALQTALAGLIAAALAGVITWAEAIASANDLLSQAGRPANAEELVGQVRDEFDRLHTERPAIDPNDPANDIFRQPETGEILVSDGSHGAPAGYVWDPWGNRWLSPDQAAGVRAQLGAPPLDEFGDPMLRSNGHQRFPDGSFVPPGWVQITDDNGTRWVSPEEGRGHVHNRRQELDSERRAREDWDRETEAGRQESESKNRTLAQQRRQAEEEAARERLADLAAEREAYDQLERVRAASERRGWDGVIDRIDDAFDEDGNIDPDYVDRLAEALANQIGREISEQNLSPSMLAETLRSLDETYGDVIPDALIDEVQRQLEETWVGDFATNTLQDMRESAALRMLSGVASGGASEAIFQSADLADAIMRDIDQAIAEGRDPDDFMVLRNAARVLAENNAPINTARLALGDEPVTPSALMGALLGDLGTLLDIGEAAGKTRLGSQALTHAAEDVGAVARRGGEAMTDAVDATVGQGTRRAAQQTAEEMAESLGHLKGRADHAVDQAFKPVTDPFNNARSVANEAADSARRSLEDALGLEVAPGSRNVVPDSARGAVDSANAPQASEIAGAEMDEWLQGQKPGTVIPLERIREAGYTPAQARALRDVAAKHGVIIGTRTTNLHSTQFIEDGTAIPKPVWMKPKTINELDSLIGGPPTNVQGQVGIFEPHPPRPPAPREAYQRFEQRKAEFNKLKPEMDRLSAEGLIEIKDGVVHKVLDSGPPSVTKPFAGDIDGVVILREDGSPVSGAEYDNIVQDLKESGAQVQHGSEANIVSDMIAIKTKGLEPGSYEYAKAERAARVAAEDLFDSLNMNHVVGNEQVIWSGRDGHTKGGYVDQLGGWQGRIDGKAPASGTPSIGRLPAEEERE